MGFEFDEDSKGRLIMLLEGEYKYLEGGVTKRSNFSKYITRIEESNYPKIPGIPQKAPPVKPAPAPAQAFEDMSPIGHPSSPTGLDITPGLSESDYSGFGTTPAPAPAVLKLSPIGDSSSPPGLEVTPRLSESSDSDDSGYDAAPAPAPAPALAPAPAPAPLARKMYFKDPLLDLSKLTHRMSPDSIRSKYSSPQQGDGDIYFKADSRGIIEEGGSMDITTKSKKDFIDGFGGSGRVTSQGIDDSAPLSGKPKPRFGQFTVSQQGDRFATLELEDSGGSGARLKYTKRRKRKTRKRRTTKRKRRTTRRKIRTKRRKIRTKRRNSIKKTKQKNKKKKYNIIYNE